MSPKAAELLNEALTLGENERADLAGALIESLDSGFDPDAERAWNEVIARRVQELEARSVEPIPWSDVRAHLFSGFE